MAARARRVYSTRGILWSTEEVDCMLRTLIGMDAGQRVMTSTHLESRGLFEEVAGAMRSHGYRRTLEQLRAKLKRIKGEFFDCLEDWRGIPPRGYRTTHFRLLRELWEQGGRPGWRLRTPNHPVVVVSSPTDGEAESPPTDSDAESAHSSGGEQAEASPPREEAIPPEEEVLVVAEEHPRVEISSATEGEAGEVQVPGPAPRPEPAQPSGQSPLQREVEDLRRTVKRLNYRLGFLERSHKRVRHILQRSQAMSRQQQRRSQDPQRAQQEGPPTV
ncbi:UNVERIFIED_CONTAM: hypothetical protein K2H54_069867 [Gekko kuhli]